MTYAEAKAAANKRNPNITYMGDAGQGWKFEVYFCSKRRRQIWTSVGPAGQRIV